MQTIIERLQRTYNCLNKENIDSDLLDQLYTDDILFQDPLHQFQSLSKLRDYFKRLYKNVDHISFNYQDVEANDREAFVTWSMTFLNRNFNKGNPVTVEGISHLKFRDGKISSHRDYFDSTHMIFDHIPLMGRIIRMIKNKL
ncbi:nuclear transport factor 2 family protein [Reinekea marina]|uniref:Nuclear transport factor 2 family protein n=1 Tax=Reinekea marina TaxID=1310421 RepID=A0ABV7WWM6_9GAMM|nr:nuclear transport factor 2 family protein [Reinekea marina]MDN3649797.1 nuclear transport factor 2 family protein [Reinekea marina]